MKYNEIEQRIKLLEDHNSCFCYNGNCIGTALFLLGLRKIDSYISSLDDYMDKLEETENPNFGDVAIFYAGDENDQYIVHMVLITEVDNNMIKTIGRCCCGEPIEKMILEEVKKRYQGPIPFSIKFYELKN